MKKNKQPQLDYYLSIDEMPIYNWFKLQETNDLTYVLKVKKECNDRELFVLRDRMKKLTAEYINTYGISQEYRQVLSLSRDLEVLKIEFLLTQDRKILTFIDIKQDELNVLTKKKEKVDLNKMTVYVSEFYGKPINTREITVLDFYNTLEEIKQRSKQKVNER